MALVDLCQRNSLDPEDLDAMVAALAAQGRGLADSDLDAMEAAWAAVKVAEKG